MDHPIQERTVVKVSVVEMHPCYNERSACRFVDPTVITPWTVSVDGKIDYLTSALKFGVKLDLIGISMNSGLMDAGLIDPTDSIDTTIALDKVFYRINGGEVQHRDFKLDAANPLVGALTPTVQGDFGHVAVELSTLIEKKPNLSTVANVRGSCNLQFGTLEVHAQCGDPDVEMLGYTIRALRANSNRARPEEIVPPTATSEGGRILPQPTKLWPRTTSA
jgi:hypothetical protein